MLAATVPDSEPAFAELCPEYGIGSARLSFAAPRGGSALPPHEARPSLGEYKLGRCDATVQQKFGPGYRFLDHNSTDFADRDQNSGTNPLRLYRLKQTIGGGGGGEGNPRGDGTDVGAEPPLLFT